MSVGSERVSIISQIPIPFTSTSLTSRATESQEISEGVVLDSDAEGNLVGIDIDHASQKLNLRELVTTHIPLETKAQS